MNGSAMPPFCVGIDPATWKSPPLSFPAVRSAGVAIAGVIAMSPEVLVLDEPTAGLDPMGRERILGQIRQYHRETGGTMLFVSH